jgi:hypothetical protein
MVAHEASEKSAAANVQFLVHRRVQRLLFRVERRKPPLLRFFGEVSCSEGGWLAPLVQLNTSLLMTRDGTIAGASRLCEM